MVHRSYASEDPLTSMRGDDLGLAEENDFVRAMMAGSQERYRTMLYEMVPGRRERDQRKQATETAATETLRAAHAALVEELLAELSALDKAVQTSALTVNERWHRTDAAHQAFDRRYSQMIQTAARVYGWSVVSSARSNLNLPS